MHMPWLAVDADAQPHTGTGPTCCLWTRADRDPPRSASDTMGILAGCSSSTSVSLAESDDSPADASCTELPSLLPLQYSTPIPARSPAEASCTELPSSLPLL